MRRLGTLDKVLLAGFVPLWLVCFGLSVKSAIRDVGVPPVHVSFPEDAAHYPKITGSWAEPTEEGPRVGDLLLRVGGADLRGVGPVRFTGTAGREMAGKHEVPIAFERNGERRETMMPVASWRIRNIPVLPASVAFAVAGMLLLLRARDSLVARYFAHAFLCTALALVCTFVDGPAEAMLAFAVFVPTWTLMSPLLLRAVLTFPSGTRPRSRWGRAAPWLFVVYGPFRVGEVWGVVLPGLGAILSLLVMTRSVGT